MSVDIVARLRDYDQCNDSDVDEAADEIEILRHALKDLREKYERLARSIRDDQCTEVHPKFKYPH